MILVLALPGAVSAQVWQIELVDSEGYVGKFTSIAMDSHDLPHITYRGKDEGGTLKYARKDLSGGWIIETADVSDNGRYTSLALDHADRPHIAYYDRALFDLRYATRSVLGTWTLQTLDSKGNVGRWTSIAVDSQNLPHISYFDESNLNLKYVRPAGIP